MPEDLPRIPRHRARLTRFEVEGSVSGVGTRTHIIRTDSDVDAWKRFCRAYSRNMCSIVAIRRPREE